MSIEMGAIEWVRRVLRDYSCRLAWATHASHMQNLVDGIEAWLTQDGRLVLILTYKNLEGFELFLSAAASDRVDVTIEDLIGFLEAPSV